MNILKCEIVVLGCNYISVLVILFVRLGEVIRGIISENPSNFVARRYILDVGLVANKIVEDIKHMKKNKGLVFDLDFEKAYDRVNWAVFR